MYSGKVQILGSHNLPKLKSRHIHHIYTTLIRNVKNSSLKTEAMNFISKHILSAPANLKNESSSLLRVWAHQCECVVAQRIRRGQQMFCLYTQIWEEQALRQFFKNVRQQAARRSKEFVFSAIGVSAFNWDKNRISDNEMKSHLDELSYTKELKNKTVACQVCNKPDQVTQTIIIYCNCEGRKQSLQTYDGWTLFIEQPELIVWRKPHSSGNFEYKVYGTYNDVTAEDFLNVQIDTTYRKTWDPSAVELSIIDKDVQADSNNDVVYWEMQWPTLFTNRDYVFKRRYFMELQNKTLLILSKGTTHPNFPPKSNKVRVEDYWSSMVIKPYSDPDKVGVEFSLTYFDNPGVNIPQSVTSWVAYRAMPDFLTRLRAAAKKYKDYCKTAQCTGSFHYKDIKPPKEINNVTMDSPVSNRTLLDHKLDPIGGMLDEITLREISVERGQGSTKKITTPPPETPSNLSGHEVLLSPTPIVQNDQSYWKYLHPTYYIS